MAGMKEALREAGLISDKAHDEASSKQDARRHSCAGQHLSKESKSRPVSMDNLKSAGSIREFKQIAKQLLERSPDVIDEIIQAAHTWKEKSGGKKLVWLMYQVRDGQQGAGGEVGRKDFLNRAFRKSGSTIK
ncbi:MAG: hypothetical protein V1853_04730 [bacterium]